MKKYLVILPLLYVFVGCNGDTLNSPQPTIEVKIDGMLYEWGNAIINPRNESFGIGVMNDDSNIYIALSTYDQETKMKIFNGLTLWINNEGKKKETFGIKYPLQMNMMDMSGMMQNDKQNNISRDSEENSDMMIEQMLSQQGDLVITSNDLERYAPIDNGEKGIQVNIANNQGNLIYELKVSLDILKISKDKIYIDIETAEIDKPKMNGGPGGGAPGGGMPSGGGMPNGGGMPSGGAPGSRMLGGGMSDRGGMSFSPVKYWIQVLLNQD